MSFDLTEIPASLAELTGTDVFTAGILASAIGIALILFPVMYLFRSKGQFLAALIVGLPISGVFVALGWLPIWIYIILILLVAIMYASSFTQKIGG